MSNHNSDHRANSDVNSAAECRLSKSWLVASLLSRVSRVWCLVSGVHCHARRTRLRLRSRVRRGLVAARGRANGAGGPGGGRLAVAEPRIQSSRLGMRGGWDRQGAPCTMHPARAVRAGCFSRPSGTPALGTRRLATRVSRLHALGGGREARSAPDAEPLPLPLSPPSASPSGEPLCDSEPCHPEPLSHFPSCRGG